MSRFETMLICGFSARGARARCIRMCFANQETVPSSIRVKALKNLKETRDIMKRFDF